MDGIPLKSCDLLEKSYLCGINNNTRIEGMSCAQL